MRLPLLFLPALMASALLASPVSADEMITEEERAALHAEIRAYLLENPEILREMIALLETQAQSDGEANDRSLVASNSDAIFDDGFSFVGGNPEGSLTIVEFLDYQCGYCRRAHPDVADLIAKDGDIRWIVKEMPILGPGSELAARAAIATLIVEGNEAYAMLNDGLMRMQGQIDERVIESALRATDLDPERILSMTDDPEVTRRLGETRALAERLAITGTPTFVFGDRMLRGYVPLAQMQALVAELRPAE